MKFRCLYHYMGRLSMKTSHSTHYLKTIHAISNKVPRTPERHAKSSHFLPTQNHGHRNHPTHSDPRLNKAILPPSTNLHRSRSSTVGSMVQYPYPTTPTPTTCPLPASTAVMARPTTPRPPTLSSSLSLSTVHDVVPSFVPSGRVKVWIVAVSDVEAWMRIINPPESEEDVEVLVALEVLEDMDDAEDVEKAGEGERDG